MAVVGLPFLLLPDTMLQVFALEPAVLATGRQVLQITALVQVLAAVGLTFAGALRGAGATVRVMLVDVGTGAGFMLPTAWLFGVVLDGGLLGAWWALVAWFALHAAIMTRLFMDRSWLRIRI